MPFADDPGFDVVVVGGANTDYLVKGPELPRPGDTATARLFQEAPGGKGANQAVAVARLGGRVAFVTCVGRDRRGAAIAEQLEAEHVDTRALVRDASAPTGVALVVVNDAGQKQIAWVPGANHSLAPAAVTAHAGLLARSRVVLVQLEIPIEVVEAAVRLARAGGARVVLDPAPATALREEILRDVHVIRPNPSEARALTGIEVTDRRSASRAAGILVRRGVRAACVGAPDGNLLVSDEGETWFPHLAVETVDETGAGDALAGALALALAEDVDLPGAVRFAHAASALATTGVGAQASLPRREAVLALLARQQAEASARSLERPSP